MKTFSSLFFAKQVSVEKKRAQLLNGFNLVHFIIHFITSILVSHKRGENVNCREVHFSSLKSLYEKSAIQNAGLRRS